MNTRGGFDYQVRFSTAQSRICQQRKKSFRAIVSHTSKGLELLEKVSFYFKILIYYYYHDFKLQFWVTIE